MSAAQHPENSFLPNCLCSLFVLWVALAPLVAMDPGTHDDQAYPPQSESTSYSYLAARATSRPVPPPPSPQSHEGDTLPSEILKSQSTLSKLAKKLTRLSLDGSPKKEAPPAVEHLIIQEKREQLKPWSVQLADFPQLKSISISGVPNAHFRSADRPGIHKQKHLARIIFDIVEATEKEGAAAPPTLMGFSVSSCPHLSELKGPVAYCTQCHALKKLVIEGLIEDATPQVSFCPCLSEISLPLNHNATCVSLPVLKSFLASPHSSAKGEFLWYEHCLNLAHVRTPCTALYIFDGCRKIQSVHTQTPDSTPVIVFMGMDEDYTQYRSLSFGKSKPIVFVDTSTLLTFLITAFPTEIYQVYMLPSEGKRALRSIEHPPAKDGLGYLDTKHITQVKKILSLYGELEKE